ncbi:MAG: hypothetical protein AMXMBFR6_13820 [Betaproteobacteria bacterium]
MGSRRHLVTSNRQRGAALPAIVAIVVLLGASLLFWYRPGTGAVTRDARSDAALAQAKAALLGYAARCGVTAVGRQPFLQQADNSCANSDQDRPGDLPCPDLDGDGETEISHCGKANGTDPARPRLGWLPWKTLGLPEPRDGSGERLWYAVATTFKNNLRAPPINSDTRGTISVRNALGNLIHDGRTGSGVVAVIIAPGAALVRADGLAQVRNAAHASDARHYLDKAPGDNAEDNADLADQDADNDGLADGNDGFITGPIADAQGRPLVNDRIVVITRDELLAAVERRVAAEARECLTHYASLHGRHPWPAPIASNERLGLPGVRFGRLPALQSDVDVAGEFQQAVARVGTARAALAGAQSATERSAAAQTLTISLQASLQQGARLHPGLATVIPDVLAARTSADALAVAASGQFSSQLLAFGTHTDTLIQHLIDTGLDLYAPVLAQTVGDLATTVGAFGAQPTMAGASTLADAAYRLARLSGLARSGNAQIASPLGNAAATANSAWTAAQQVLATGVGDAGAISNAVNLGNLAVTTAEGLRQAIETQRVFGFSQATALQLADGVRAIVAMPASVEMAATLRAGAQAATAALTRLQTQASGILPVRQAALDAAAQTESAAAAALADPTAAKLAAAASAGANLANAIATTTLGQVSGGLALTLQLVTAAVDQSSARLRRQELLTLLANYSAAPGPTSEQALRTAARDTAELLGLLGQTLPGAGDDLQDLLAALDPASGTLPSLLRTAVAEAVDVIGSASDLQTGQALAAADAALAALAALPVPRGSAGAKIAVVWDDGTGCHKWFADNDWPTRVYYQLAADPAHPLTIDGKPYALVVLIPGHALTGQLRPSADIRQYFEGEANPFGLPDPASNAHPSRNGLAASPDPRFIQRPLSPGFNDQLVGRT